MQTAILKDPQLAIEQRKQLYDKQGYLWVYDSSKKKVIASAAHSGLTSAKYFCQYRVKERQLTLTQYHQVNPPKNVSEDLPSTLFELMSLLSFQVTVDYYKVKQCKRRATSESERQFLFDLTLYHIDK